MALSGNVRAAIRRFISKCPKYGAQDALHKRTLPSDTPITWVDTVCHTSEEGIVKTVSQEDWKKVQSLVLELAGIVKKAAAVEDQESEAAKVSHQRLLKIQGFLNYVARTSEPLHEGSARYNIRVVL